MSLPAAERTAASAADQLELKKAHFEDAAASDMAGNRASAGGSTVMLGSSSKWRAALIKDALEERFELFPERLRLKILVGITKLDFFKPSQRVPGSPGIDEKAIRRTDPKEMVVAIANAKADALVAFLAARPDSTAKPDLLLCADQVIVFDGVTREKPESKEQCKEHLQSYGLQEKPAECMTGIVVVNLASGERRSGVDVAVQYFKKVPDSVAEALIAKGDIMYCAGSIVVEDELLLPYLGERVGEIESVQGMPVAITNRLLNEVVAE